MDGYRLAIIIPAFNEAATIASVVRGVSEHGRAIVVDDCSSDDTSGLAARAGALVLRNERNLGYDGSLNRGFAEASRGGFEFAVTFDADGQHDAAVLGRFREQLECGHHLVLGVRPEPDRLAEWLFAAYTRMRFGWRDPLCGMKGYRLQIYRDLGWFDSYRSIGTELALYAVRRGCRFVQIPVPIHARADAPRFGSLLRANFRILRALVLACRAPRRAIR